MWRIIPSEIHDAYMNMALDEACMEALSQDRVPPTVRFYRWSPSAVSIGTFQSMNDEVALNICRERRIDVVRRRTGGGAVYHDTDGEITYSVIAPEKLFPQDIIESYRVICAWIIDTLKMLGIQEAVFHPINDILAYGKKISGNAQTRRQNVLLQHGTILYQVDVRKMFSVLTVGQDKLADKLIKAIEDRVTSIHDLLPEVSREDVEKALMHSFAQGVGSLKNSRSSTHLHFGDLDTVMRGTWTKDEIQRASELINERYACEQWNFLR